MPRFSEETLRRVAEATDIVELIGSYFPLKRAGTSYRALCPFHNEKTPSFHVNPARQAYHCFGCGAGGGVFRFLMEYEHIEFGEAVRRLASRAGVPVIEEAGSAEDDGRERRRKRLLAVNAEAERWFGVQLTKTAEGAGAREYLKSRGINAETAKFWGIGYAPDSWDALLEHLRAAGFQQAEIREAGLASSKDESDPKARLYARFRGRVMFPIRNDYGETLAFSGRLLEADAKAAKYVNTPETPLFTKGRLLYGLDKAKRALIATKEALVCEGQIDVIAAVAAGIPHAIAPQGTAFTPDQARLLARFVDSALLCFDSDRAGQEAISRSLPALLEHGLSVRVVALPEGHDPDSLIRAEGPEAFRTLVAGARDFFDHALVRAMESGILADPSRLAAASRKLGTFAAHIRDPVAREAVVGKICARLGIAPATFRANLRTPAPQIVAEGNEAPAVASVPLSETMKILCRNALLDRESRRWLSENGARHASEIEPGGALLERIVEADAGVADEAAPAPDPAAFSAFSSTLPVELERALSALDLAHKPVDAFEASRESWNALAARPIKEKMAVVAARIRDPQLTFEERIELQKQILDLSRKLNEIPRSAA